MKVAIKKWALCTSWYWNIPCHEICGICRISFDGCCPDCKLPGKYCPPILGKCRHYFHTHCLMKWLETNTQCPMCRQSWEKYDLANS